MQILMQTQIKYMEVSKTFHFVSKKPQVIPAFASLSDVKIAILILIAGCCPFPQLCNITCDSAVGKWP